MQHEVFATFTVNISDTPNYLFDNLKDNDYKYIKREVSQFYFKFKKANFDFFDYFCRSNFQTTCNDRVI